jgi:hypothetical protein
MKKAYLVKVEGWDGSEGVAAAESHAQAKYIGFKSARDVDFNIPYLRFRARRAPDFDAWAEVDTARVVMTREAVERACRRADAGATQLRQRIPPLHNP